MFWVQVVDGQVRRWGESENNMPGGANQFESEQDAIDKLPLFKAHIEDSRQRKASHNIDAGAGVDVMRSHLAKAGEAERVLFDGVLDLNRLPYLRAELKKQPGVALRELARSIWQKHCRHAPAREAARTKKKREMRDA